MARPNDDGVRQAIALFQTGRLNDAEHLLKKVLRNQPNNFSALNLLSVLLAQVKRYAEAERYVKLALEINYNSDVTFYNYGLILKALKRPNEALECFSRALSINSTVAETWNNRGTIFSDLKCYDDAVVDFNKAIERQPNYSEAFCNKGNSLIELKRYDEAFDAFNRALAIKPDLAGAWIGRGRVFGDLRRHDEAFAAYDKALALNADLAEAWLGRGNLFNQLKRYDEAFADYDKALTLSDDLAEAWLGRGNLFNQLKDYDKAFVAYDKALALKPDLAEAWVGCGNVFGDLRRHEEAFAAYDKALALKSDLAEAWVGRGNVFSDIEHYDEAFAAYEKALGIKPDLVEAWVGCGNVFNDLKRYDEAFAAYDRAFVIQPDLIGVEGARLHAKMNLCNWKEFRADCDHLIQSVKSNQPSTPPFPFLGVSSTAGEQLNNANMWIIKKHPPSPRPFWAGEVHKHNKVRIGYMSADLRQHAVSYLIGGVFENHNRSQFETVAISIGPNDNSENRRRLEISFDQFIDVKSLNADAIAKKIREMEIDILIDLNGFTKDARTEVFACRPAPIQVNYLGYAGTMGVNYFDYIIADPILIPAYHQSNYAEKVIYLPHSYMPHDEKSRSISDYSLKRRDFELPENGFVFCCFNNSYKLNPNVFRSWMVLLKAIDGSVLWLSEAAIPAVNNLRKEAGAAGVNPERLIFARRLPSSAQHLARHRLADLFLDTLPYNAHTTASDALWAGLPILTQIGDTFAGRVAASLLSAIGLPELITTTQEAYEEMAIDLATHPEKLAAVKNKLANNRLTTPLFDTEIFTKHIEAAYMAMYERYQAGLAPDHIVIAK